MAFMSTQRETRLTTLAWTVYGVSPTSRVSRVEQGMSNQHFSLYRYYCYYGPLFAAGGNGMAKDCRNVEMM